MSGPSVQRVQSVQSLGRAWASDRMAQAGLKHPLVQDGQAKHPSDSGAPAGVLSFNGELSAVSCFFFFGVLREF